jgi:hypothetical protein
MRQYNATTLEDQIQDLAEFVEREGQESQKAIKMQLIILGVVSLILIAYFMILNAEIRKATEPKELAKQAAVIIDDNVPDLGKMLEDVLNESTPQVAKFIGSQAIEQGVPFLVKQSEDVLASYITAATKETATWLDTAFQQLLKENKAVFIEALKSENLQGAALDPKLVMKPVLAEFKKTFDSQASSSDSEARVAVRQTLVALKNINSRLKHLSTVDASELSAREAKSARLLRTWWKWQRTRTVEDIDTMPVQNPSKPKSDG